MNMNEHSHSSPLSFAHNKIEICSRETPLSSTKPSPSIQQTAERDEEGWVVPYIHTQEWMKDADRNDINS